MVRLWCVTVYVFNESGTECLLMDHRKLGKWMPPGGKIDPNELPDTAALRETFEETGLRVKLVGGKTPVDGGLARTYGVQQNVVIPGEREHIDLIYAAVPVVESSLKVSEREAAGLKWFPVEKVLEQDFNTFESVKQWFRILQPEISKGPSHEKRRTHNTARP